MKWDENECVVYYMRESFLIIVVRGGQTFPAVEGSAVASAGD